MRGGGFVDQWRVRGEGVEGFAVGCDIEQAMALELAVHLDQGLADFAQQSDGGRLIMPVGPPSHQQMIRLSRRGDTFERDILGSFGFVPLVADEPAN